MTIADLNAQLAAADEQTNQIATAVASAGTSIAEISSDMDDLIAKLAAGTPGSAEVEAAVSAATALTERLSSTASALGQTATDLQEVASKHTP